MRTSTGAGPARSLPHRHRLSSRIGRNTRWGFRLARRDRGRVVPPRQAASHKQGRSFEVSRAILLDSPHRCPRPSLARALRSPHGDVPGERLIRHASDPRQPSRSGRRAERTPSGGPRCVPPLRDDLLPVTPPPGRDHLLIPGGRRTRATRAKCRKPLRESDRPRVRGPPVLRLLLVQGCLPHAERH